MPFIDYNTRNHVRIWDGIHGALHHSDQLTCGLITLQEGVLLPEHHHVHEQWTHVLEGQLEFRIGSETRTLGPGMCAHIPSNVPHAGRAVTACKAIDVFHPVRADFQDLERQQYGSDAATQPIGT